MHSGDAIAVGATTISLHGDDAHVDPTRAAAAGREPVAGHPRPAPPAGGARPAAARRARVVPATNRQIADELTISVETVKGTLSALYELFGLTGLAQNEKRAALAVRWLQSVVDPLERVVAERR